MTEEIDIVSLYKTLIEQKKEPPLYRDFLAHGVSRDMIRRRHGGIEELHKHMRETFPEFLASIFSSVEDIFSNERSVEHSKKKLFVVTTAVADSKADVNFLSALDVYCELHNAQIVIMPCESITNSFEKKTAIFDPIFNDPKYMFVHADTPLNENIALCSIQVSAKQLKPITGLTRLGNREGSYVFASPKQFLEYIPSGNSRGKNYTIMTPGACTQSNYYTETFVSKRLSYIADFDHTIGAIIIEIKDDKTFDFRQIQADESGAFIDMGVKYCADGSTNKVPASIVFGDLHGVYVDGAALDFFIEKFKQFDIDSVFLHDIFDGHSISHHIKTIGEKATRAMSNADSLYDELHFTYALVKAIDDDLRPNNVFIVKSNHDEFLDRYLADARYVFDPENHYLSLKIAQALFEDNDVMKHAFDCIGYESPENWIYLNRDESVRIGDVECGSHGDLGLNGAKSSLNSLEKIYGKCIVAHNHTAAIQRNVFRVGTLSKLDMKYNRGPSSWTHTCALIYENGQRQLINYIP